MVMPKGFGGLGFRRLHEFNLALLGKQGWNIVTRPESLAARILKARYFPTCDFIDAPLGSNPSYVWRSIWEAKNVVRDGIYWRVGTGRRIFIWDSPWLPDADNSYISEPRPPGVSVFLVADLIQNGCWNEGLLSSLFNDRDIACIKSIPLGRRQVEDKPCWKFDAKGKYTVKSAYRRLVEVPVQSAVLSTGAWKKLWSLCLPPKVLCFFWQLARNILPVRSLLLARWVDVVDVCPVCACSGETVQHLFVECPLAVNVWALASLSIQMHGVDSFGGWLERLLTGAPLNDILLGVLLCWSLWTNRNDVVWRNRRRTATNVLALARRVLSDWSAAHARPVAPAVVAGREASWSADRFQLRYVSASARVNCSISSVDPQRQGQSTGFLPSKFAKQLSRVVCQ